MPELERTSLFTDEPVDKLDQIQASIDGLSAQVESLTVLVQQILARHKELERDLKRGRDEPLQTVSAAHPISVSSRQVNQPCRSPGFVPRFTPPSPPIAATSPGFGQNPALMGTSPGGAIPTLTAMSVPERTLNTFNAVVNMAYEAVANSGLIANGSNPMELPPPRVSPTSPLPTARASIMAVHGSAADGASASDECSSEPPQLPTTAVRPPSSSATPVQPAIKLKPKSGGEDVSAVFAMKQHDLLSQLERYRK